MKLLLNKSKQSGSQLVEYLILAMLVFLSVAIAIETFGDQVNLALDSVTAEISEIGAVLDAGAYTAGS